MAVSGLQQDGINNRVVYDDGFVGYADSAGVVYTRIGWRTIAQLGKKLCAIQTGFQPLLRRLFADVPLILILLDVINIMCVHVTPTMRHMADGGSVSDAPSTTQQVVADLQAIVDKYQGA